jgi:hypothetical protein
MKKMIILTFALIAVFLSAMVAPTFAAAPTVVNDVWLVIPIFVKSDYAPIPVSITPDKVWTSDDGTVLHSRNTEISTYIAHTPSGLPPGTIRWGTMEAVSNFVFDTVSNTGTFTMKITLTLTKATSNNPLYPAANYENNYGLGTLECTLVVEVTSLNPYVGPAINCPMPGAGQGQLVATHGTGAFENAKLSADVTLEPGFSIRPGVFNLGIEYLFIGHHYQHDYNQGTLTFHNPGPSH